MFLGETYGQEKDDPISVNTVLSYDISRAKKSCKLTSEEQREFDVSEFQLIHIEPVPLEIDNVRKYGDGAYYIPLLMKGKSKEEITAKIINTKNIGLTIDSFYINYSMPTSRRKKGIYDIHINLRYCKKQDTCYNTEKLATCSNCKKDEIVFKGGQRIDIHSNFPFPKTEEQKMVGEGKICRGYTN